MSPEPPRPVDANPWTARPPVRAARLANTLPEWLGSIRFRLTALYSLFLFGLAAIVVGGIYIAVSMRLARRGGLAVADAHRKTGMGTGSTS